MQPPKLLSKCKIADPDSFSTGGVLLAVSGWLWLETFAPQYKLSGMGGAFSSIFFPRVLLALWSVLALLVMAQAIWRSGPKIRLIAPARFCGVSIGFAIYAAAVFYIGFFIATFAALFAAGSFLSKARVSQNLIYAIVTSAVSWMLFTKVLRIALPSANLPLGF